MRYPIEVALSALVGWLGLICQNYHITKSNTAVSNTLMIDTHYHPMLAPPFVPSTIVSPTIVSPPIVSTLTATPSFVPPSNTSTSLASPPFISSPFILFPAYQQHAYFSFHPVLMGLGVVLLLTLTPNLAQYFKVSPQTFNTVISHLADSFETLMSLATLSPTSEGCAFVALLGIRHLINSNDTSRVKELQRWYDQNVKKETTDVVPLFESQAYQDSNTIVNGTLRNRRGWHLLPTSDTNIECILAGFETSIESINSQLHDKDEELQREQSEKDKIVQQLELEHHKLTESLENATKERGEMDESIIELYAKLEIAEEQCMEYKGKAERLSLELSDVQKEPAAKSSGRLFARRMKLAATDRQSRETTISLELDESKQEVAASRKAIVVLQSSNEDLKQRNSELLEKEIESVEAMASLQSDYEDLKKNFGKVSKEAEDVGKTVTDLKTAEKNLKQRDSEMSEKARKSAEAMNKLQSDHQALQAKCVEMAREAEKASIKAHANLETVNADLKTASVDLETANADLETANANLGTANAYLGAANAALEESKTTSQNTINDFRTAYTTLLELNTELSKKTSKSDDTIRDLKTSLSNKQTELVRATDLNFAAYQANQKVNATLKEQLLAEQKKVAVLSEELHVLKAKMQAGDLQGMSNQDTQLVEGLRGELEGFEKMEQHMKEVKVELRDAYSKISEKDNSLNKASSELTQLRIGLDEVNKKLAKNDSDLKKELKTLKDLKSGQYNELAKVKEELKEANAKVKQNESNDVLLKEARIEISNLQKKLEQTIDDCLAGQDAEDDLKNQVEKLVLEKAKLDKKVKSLERKLVGDDDESSEETETPNEVKQAEHYSLQSESPKQDDDISEQTDSSNEDMQEEHTSSRSVPSQAPKKASTERVKLQPRSRKAKLNIDGTMSEQETKPSPEPKILEDPKPLEDSKLLVEGTLQPKAKSSSEVISSPDAPSPPKTESSADFELIPDYRFDFVLKKAPPIAKPTTHDTESESPLLSENRLRAVFDGVAKTGSETAASLPNPTLSSSDENIRILEELLGMNKQSEENGGEDVVMGDTDLANAYAPDPGSSAPSSNFGPSSARQETTSKADANTGFGNEDTNKTNDPALPESTDETDHDVLWDKANVKWPAMENDPDFDGLEVSNQPMDDSEKMTEEETERIIGDMLATGHFDSEEEFDDSAINDIMGTQVDGEIEHRVTAPNVEIDDEL